MRRGVSAAVVVLVIVIVLVVIFAIYKFTVGKPKPVVVKESAPGVPEGVSPQQYQQHAQPGGGGGAPGQPTNSLGQ